MTVDEFEALRLSDLNGLYQDDAAEHMKVSRQTFGRIIDSAHRKVAQALVEGKALRIEGGEFTVVQSSKFRCYQCQHDWELGHGTGRPTVCPKCGDANIHRAEEDRGWARSAQGNPGRGQRGQCCRWGPNSQTQSASKGESK